MKRAINYYFLCLAIFLTAFGLLFLSTLSAIASLQVFGNTNYYLFHQLIALAIGVACGLIFFAIPLHVLKKMTPILFFVNILALVVVFLPIIGTKFWGASRWISIGNNTFQPSEFFKITTILYLSAWLSNKFSNSSRKGWAGLAKKGYDTFTKVYVPFLIFLGIISVIFFLQKDISTLGIISVALIAIYFAAETPLWNTVLTIAAGIGGVFALIKIEPYRAQRLLTFLHPNQDPLGMGLQLKQSLIALGSGGFFGKGLGMSTQKFGFLPQAMSDSMFAILGEETGIIGCVILIILFLFFLWLGFKIANASTDRFSKLTAIGITTWIVFQAFVNIASTIGLFPLSGIPLPFFSYGGSHIIAEMIGVGLLLNISKNG
jgi:cell division protein FtsW